MRIAIISDIHGNLQALNAVLKDIKNNKVDSIVCLGDIATLGPSPKEVLKIIKNLNCKCIMGNHEEVLFNLNNADIYDIKGELLYKTINWCLKKLNEDDINFLKTFHSKLLFKLENNRNLLCYHGSPKSSIGIINNKTSSYEIDDLFNEIESINIAVGGHSHIQMLREHKDFLIVNTGSVGCSFENSFNLGNTPSLLPYAEYIIIDSNNNISVEFKRVEFDIQSFVNILKKSDIPLKKWWLDEYLKFGYK